MARKLTGAAAVPKLRGVNRMPASPTLVLLRSLAALLLCLCAGCVPPRDDAAALACTTSAQCPADGKHYCDRATGTCAQCAGICPWASAPTQSLDAGSTSDATVDTRADDAEVTGLDADADTQATTTDVCTPLAAPDGGEDAASSTTCANRGCASYSATASCQCDGTCADLGDCCADYVTLCCAAAK